MLKEKVKYVDYNGIEREEEFLFNLTQSELVEMVATSTEPLDEKMKRIVVSNDGTEIMKLFKDILLKAYGEKSSDGKRFVKGSEISKGFTETEAYNKIFMRLVTEPDYAEKFINSILPKDE